MNRFSKQEKYNYKNIDIVAKIIIQLKKLKKLNKAYSKNVDKNGIDFINSVLEMLGVKCEVDNIDIGRIPEKGAFVLISNSPLGGIESLLLLKLILSKRPDFKILADLSIHQISPLNEFSIPLNNQLHKAKKFEFSTTKIVSEHLNNGMAVGVFPSGGVSKIYGLNNIYDGKWKNSIIKFIKDSKVPVVPVFIKSKSPNIFGNVVNSTLSRINLGEKFKVKDKSVKIRIGKPIKPKEQDEFNEIDIFSRFLRVKIYALGTNLKVNNFFRSKLKARVQKVEDIIKPVDTKRLISEIKKIKENYFLFDSNEYSVVCAPSIEIPDILTEIGRLRELTFREIGEGTNRSVDLDEFDLYYNHLIIWDNKKNKIVGAYRVGRGDEIMQQYGVKGFYLQSLFKMKKEFFPILNEAIELGRSFIIKDYQKKPLSLFLLWKGILYFLLKNHQYRYLLGPASISNNFSKFSQSLIVDFFKENYFDNELAKFIKPRKQFKIKSNPNFHKDIFIKSTLKDVKKLDKFIQDIEPDYSTPVLFKKYIQLNARLLGFNVDPRFNNCVDGLMLLDIFDVPLNILQALSKELEDTSILSRFNF